MIGENRYLGGEDYKNLFQLIRLAQAAEKKELAAVLQKQAKTEI